MFVFLQEHKLFLFQMVAMGALNTSGQFFVYRMANQFKQHYVPCILTTRYIMTVLLSIIFYGHKTNFWQILGMLIVFGMLSYEMLSEIRVDKSAK